MSLEASSLAAVPGLVRSDPHGPGITRIRAEDGIRYLDPAGAEVTDTATLDRIRALRIPPAWAERLASGAEDRGGAFTGGIRVEWLGTPAGVREGPWPLAAAEWSVASPFDEIRWENRSLRVPPLDVQRQVEVQRQRRDRVAAIDAFTTGQRDGSRR
jgi:hypothetical protein